MSVDDAERLHKQFKDRPIEGSDKKIEVFFEVSRPKGNTGGLKQESE